MFVAQAKEADLKSLIVDDFNYGRDEVKRKLRPDILQ